MSKSTDEKVTTDLIETLRDGEKGFLEAAKKLDDSPRADLAKSFREASTQRSTYAKELEALAAAYGDDIDESGSFVATLHRGWLSLKDALAGDSIDGVVSAAATGERHAVSEYERALDEDISDNLRTVILRQQTEVVATASMVVALDEMHS